MPYKSSSKKPYRKNKTFYKKRTYPLSQTQKRQVRSIVKRVNPPELKYTVGTFNTTISNVATIYELVNYPIQGVEGYADEQNLDSTNGASRIGNQITIKNIQWRWTITIGDAINYVRVILFQFMDSTTIVTPLPGDVICDVANNPWIQPINPLNRQKIRILFDKTYHLQSGGQETVTRKLNIKPPTKDIRFATNITAGFAAEVIKGKLFYLLVSDSGAIAHPSWQNTVRLCFTDS